jgi:uncharacterized protein YerC
VKLDDVYWLYELKCIPSGKLYRGLTGKPNPFWRFSDHFVELRNGISPLPLLQAEWNLYPSLFDWHFQTIDRVHGKPAANLREAELLRAIPDLLSLNCKTALLISLAKRDRVLSMLDEGHTYRVIAKEAGVSLGMVAKLYTLRKSTMKPKQIKDVKPDGFFTINGAVYKRVSEDSILKMDSVDFGSPVTLDPARSCLPLDRRGAQVILDSK